MAVNNPNGSAKPTEARQQGQTEKVSLTLDGATKIVKTAIHTVLTRLRTGYVCSDRGVTKKYPPLGRKPSPVLKAIQPTSCFENGSLAMNERDLVDVIMEVEDSLRVANFLEKDCGLEHLEQIPLSTTVGGLADAIYSAVTGGKSAASHPPIRKRRVPAVDALVEH